MEKFSPKFGMSTLVNCVGERQDPSDAHVAPIYQTSVFTFPDFASADAILSGEQEGYFYTRLDNPNFRLLENKYALLEGLDLVRASPESRPEDVVAGKVFSSGMAAVTAAILACAQKGDVLVVQHSLYSDTFGFLNTFAPRMGIEVVWVKENSREAWECALTQQEKVRLIIAETPTNPAMQIVDLSMLSELARGHDCWLLVDNTFPTPYGQRPLTLGADMVVHSTTKYLSGHGVIVGGVVVSRHVDFVRGDLQWIRRRFGAVASPFDAWLANLGLRTFELRMERHCQNAMRIARYLDSHPKVKVVHYPGLENHPEHELARRQMHAFGGMMAFELKGGFDAAKKMLESVKVATLGVSLGKVDTMIQHPAGMTHSRVPPEVRMEMGITEGLIRLSVGIENVEDLIEDFERALEQA
ncbi:MAG: methionine gamma-lyase [Chloroflexi bacterium RBG_16_48_8]|nr:MAG: methionine gamma-lyase [Chloroflexi bacterium RBG_16_48_8]